MTADDIKLQVAILGLGQTLSRHSTRRSMQERSGTPDEIPSQVERVLGQMRASPYRRIIGIKQNHETPHDGMRLKAFAVVAWEMVSEVAPSICVETLSAAIGDDSQPLCEQLLMSRDIIGRMVGERLLILAPNGGGWSGRLLLPPKVFSWVLGGKQSCGDFDLAKVGEFARPGKGADDGGTARKSNPTAKQLYAAVRQDVIGLDQQLQILCSRFALHCIRAHALKSGADHTGISQMVICIVGPSGSGKSYTVSRLAEHCGLAHCLYDTTAWTSAGFVGDDLDTPFKILVKNLGGDLDRASQGIIFLDEFDKKSTRYGRDVCTLACQQELLGRLQAIGPFTVGGKRSATLEPPFVMDGRGIGYILGGVFAGLDEIVEQMAGRRGIGYASVSGTRQHVRIQDAMKELGFLEELVNRISCVVRLPVPTVESVGRAIAATSRKFNETLLAQGFGLLMTEAAIVEIASYAIESHGYYRAGQMVLEAIAEEYLFDERVGRFKVERDDAVRVIARVSSGVVSCSQTTSPKDIPESLSCVDYDGSSAQVAGG